MEEFNVRGKDKDIIFIVLGLILVIGVFVYAYWYFNIRNIELKFTEIDNFQFVGDTNKEVEFSEDIGLNLKEEAAALAVKYNDVKGWFKVPGTSIDYPVFQSSDNNRYLRHNRDNVNDMWGELLLDYRNNVNNMYDMKNFIIYGHNTEEDSWFTPLLNYRSKEFFDNHKYIEFSTINDNYKWEIFTVYLTTTDFFYIDTVFKDKNEYYDFLTTCKNKSLYDTGVSISKDDTILTLTTCEYSKVNGRFVVQAKLVR